MEVLRKYPAHLGCQDGVPLCSNRQPDRIAPLGRMVMIAGRGDRQHLADRLDPVSLPVIVDERDHGLNRRSSSAWAKYADALRKISLACRNSRFSRSRAFSRLATSVGRPARVPRYPLPPSLPSRSAPAPCSRSWLRSRKSLPTARDAPARDPAPSAPHGHALQEKTCSPSSLSWLHLLKSWSLRHSRGGSGCIGCRAAMTRPSHFSSGRSPALRRCSGQSILTRSPSSTT
jgi:hypothetical protein